MLRAFEQLVVERCLVSYKGNQILLKMFSEIRMCSEMLRAFEQSLDICLVVATAVVISDSH